MTAAPDETPTPAMIPLIIPPGEWNVFASVLTRLDELVRRCPPGPVYVIAGSHVLATLTPELAARLADCARPVRAATRPKTLPLRVYIGRQIKARRTKLGITQEQLAERTGWTRQQFGEIERGERDLTDAQLADIASKIGTTAGNLRSM